METSRLAFPPPPVGPAISPHRGTLPGWGKGGESPHLAWSNDPLIVHSVRTFKNCSYFTHQLLTSSKKLSLANSRPCWYLVQTASSAPRHTLTRQESGSWEGSGWCQGSQSGPAPPCGLWFSLEFHSRPKPPESPVAPLGYRLEAVKFSVEDPLPP